MKLQKEGQKIKNLIMYCISTSMGAISTKHKQHVDASFLY